MLKKVLTGTGIAAVLATVFLLGSLLVGTVSAQPPDDEQTGDEVEEVDLDDVEEEVGDQSELDDDADEAAVEDPVGGLESQVEQYGEFEGEF